LELGIAEVSLRDDRRGICCRGPRAAWRLVLVDVGTFQCPSGGRWGGAVVMGVIMAVVMAGVMVVRGQGKFPIDSGARMRLSGGSY
jgi:hypothetical protein